MRIGKKELNRQIKNLVGCSLSPLSGTYLLKLNNIESVDDKIIFVKETDKKMIKRLSYLRILIENLLEFPAISPTQVLDLGFSSIKELVILLANTPNIGYFKERSVIYLTVECKPHKAGSVQQLLPGEASQLIGKISKFESLDRKYLLKELVNVYNTLHLLAKEDRDENSEVNILLKQLKEFKSQADAIFDNEKSPEAEIESAGVFNKQFGEPDGEDEDEEDGNLKFDPSKLDIKTNTPTIDLMMTRIRYKDIILNPDFQRNDRIWKEADKSALIESILLKIPIPVFYMSAQENDEWLVVDGLQRLTTMYDFITDQFSLNGLKVLTQYNGIKFSQFPRSIARRIRETELVVHVIQSGSPKNATTQIFHRINTRGEKLSAQEIRSSLNVGYATRLLAKLAESEAFITATNDNINPNRMQDIEYVLRFCAFYLEPDHNKVKIKTMDSFLTKTMVWFNKEGPDSAAVKALEENFLKAMTFSRRLFGQFAFRKKYDEPVANHINKALFETWSVNLARLSLNDLETLVLKKDILITCFGQLMSGILILAEWEGEENQDKNFEFSISQSTAKNDMIRYRYKSINTLIQKVINDDCQATTEKL